MQVLKTITLPQLGKRYQGKTRDYYIVKDKRIIISTDRISAFDRVLGHIPYKGHVLNNLSIFWFQKTRDIIENHFIESPDPNVMIVKECQLIPIEMVVRGYITGVTGTSIWGSYKKGERIIYGIQFPNGLVKNQKLSHPVITPTTKATSGHDERLTKKEIIERGIVSKKIYEQMEQISLRLFNRGSRVCKRNGILLVDTKYEFGIYKGKLLLIDEIHTPDSSRFWIRKTYIKRFLQGIEPENFDKEFLRLWFQKKGYSGDGTPPRIPKKLIQEVSTRYQDIYRILTGESVIHSHSPIAKRIASNIKKLNL